MEVLSNRSPRRPDTPRGTRSDAVAREVFEAEIVVFVQALVALFGSAHGDRTVAIALANPAANTAPPSHVLETLKSLELPPGRLWHLFKDCGGVSKEDPFGDGTNECDQLRVLGELWSRLLENKIER
jgi:hypothetical protein